MPVSSSAASISSASAAALGHTDCRPKKNAVFFDAKQNRTPPAFRNDAKNTVRRIFFFVFAFCKIRVRDSASPANPKSARHGAVAFVVHNSRLSTSIDADKFSLDLSLWMSRISLKRTFVTSMLGNCLLQLEVTERSLGKTLKGK